MVQNKLNVKYRLCKTIKWIGWTSLVCDNNNCNYVNPLLLDCVVGTSIIKIFQILIHLCMEYSEQFRCCIRINYYDKTILFIIALCNYKSFIYFIIEILCSENILMTTPTLVYIIYERLSIKNKSKSFLFNTQYTK